MGGAAYGGKGSKEMEMQTTIQPVMPNPHPDSSLWTRHGAVKQGKSGGSVGTTDQGKGKGRSGERPMGTTACGGKGQGKGKGSREGRIGQGGRGRIQGGEKPMGTTAYGGKGSKGRAANGDQPVGAASCKREQYTKATCPHPEWLLWSPTHGLAAWYHRAYTARMRMQSHSCSVMYSNRYGSPCICYLFGLGLLLLCALV